MQHLEVRDCKNKQIVHSSKIIAYIWIGEIDVADGALI